MNQIELRRSRSRTRGSKDFRILDESNGTSKNIKTTETVPRGHRSLSRISLMKRDSDQLLQTALVNQNLRHSSPAPEIQKNLSKKNSIRSLNEGKNKHIPMKEVRPIMKRWNSIQYLSNDETEKEIEGNSISPLTVIKDQYDTKRPVSNYATPIADNYYRDLDHRVNERSSDEIIDDLKTTNTTPMESLTNKIYNKMTKLLGNEKDPKKADFKYKNDSTNASLLKYQSELDDEEDDEEEFNEETQDDEWASPNVEENIDLNLDNIMTEINDFQNNFVQKFNATTPQSEFEPETSSRIQRKILDYKDLYQEETLSKNSSYFSLKLQNLQNQTSNIFNDYNFKIQYEKITQEYNLIRLRFNNISNYNNYSLKGEPVNQTNTKEHLKSNVGVLGFLNRVKTLEQKEHQVAQTLLKKPPHKSSILNVDEYLMNIWTEEMESFTESSTQSSANTSQTQLPLQLATKSDYGFYNTPGPPIHNSHSHHLMSQINTPLSNKSSFDVTQSNSFSELAGKVKLRN